MTMKRDVYKILNEKFEAVYTEAKVNRQVPFLDDEHKILYALYDFKRSKANPDVMVRIPAAGEIECVMKYSDGLFVKITEDARGKIRHEYNSFYELVQKLVLIYKADRRLDQLQTPEQPGEPYGVEPGGQRPGVS